MFKSLNLFGNAPAAIGIDWLQLYVELPIDDIVKNTYYDVILQSFQTRQFKKVYEIKTNGDRLPLATLAAEAHSNIMAKNTGVLKIENCCLYQNDLKSWVNNLLLKLNLKLLNVTRIDYFIDFQKFLGDVTPTEFIKEFVSGNIIKMGKSKFQINGSVKKIFTYDYLKFGSKTSEINYYLYNKSKELKEVKNKPYITRMWDKLNINQEENDVWRLEFSIKSSQKIFINEFGEEISSMKNLSMCEHNVIKKYLNLLLDKYWRYATPKNFAADKCSTRVKLIKFFNLDAVKEFWCRISEKLTSNRMDKVFLKKLISLKKDYGPKFDVYNKNIDIISEYFSRTRNLGYYLKL
jgi:hypothetical protein